MDIGLAYWIMMLLWLLLGTWRNWGDPAAVGKTCLSFLLFLLLGWKVFGPPLHG